MHSSNQPVIYDSANTKNPALAELREVFRYRNLVAQLARREILTRYKRSVLGIAWTMLNPLGMMLVMTIAFSRLFSSIEGYPVYVLSGLVVWTFFSQTTTASMVNLVWGGTLLNRIYIPRASFAISAIITGLVNLCFALIPIVIISLIIGHPIRATFFLVPIPLILIAAFSLGVGLLLSTLAVYFPDVAEMYQIFLTAWMYMTPVFYPETIFPESLRWWLTRFNPMYHLLRLFRTLIYEGQIPQWYEIWPALVIAITALITGWIVFSNKSDEFGYRI